MCGSVALYQRDFDYSAEKFAEAEALSPNSADFLVQHADALSCFGEENSGWEHFERAIAIYTVELGPDHPILVRVKTNLGNNLVRAGDLPAA